LAKSELLTSAMDRVALVFGFGTSPGGGGKMLANYFLPEFAKALARDGVGFRAYPESESFIESGWGGPNTIVILLYSEDIFARTLWVREAVKHYQDRFVAEGLAGLIVHSKEQAEILCNKRSTNKFYSEHRIPVPELITPENAGTATKIFSNTTLGTKCATYVLSEHDRLDEDRYNARFIDTTFGHRGQRYYVSLRAMCVGKEVIGVFVRARTVEEADASVHTGDTPVDSELLNAIYREVAEPRLPAIAGICFKIGQALGPGFYAHDLLPESGSDRVLVSESGFKFDDKVYRTRVEPLQGQLLFETGLFGDEREKAAAALLNAARDASAHRRSS
jgi:hypothetical protein